MFYKYGKRICCFLILLRCMPRGSSLCKSEWCCLVPLTTTAFKYDSYKCEIRFLVRWVSRHPVDGHFLKKIVLLFIHVALKIVPLSRLYSTFWTPTFEILAKSLCEISIKLPVMLTQQTSLHFQQLIIPVLFRSFSYM